MHLDQVTHDCESDPQPSVLSRESAVGLSESIEHKGQEFFADALAAVGNRYACATSDALEPDYYATLTWSELYCVREQIPDDLLQTIGVAGDRARGRIKQYLEANILCVGCRSHGLEGGLDHRTEFDRPHIEPELAGHDSGHVQQIFDHLTEQPGVPLNCLQRAHRCLLIKSSSAHKMGPTQNRVQRSAQLVRHYCEELILDAIRLGQLVCARFNGTLEIDGMTLEGRLLFFKPPA